MAGPPVVLIAGGSGVFGRLLARELLRSTSARIVLAGRDVRKSERVAQSLGATRRVEARRVDLADVAALPPAIAECFAVVCAAGPFQTLPRHLPREAVRAGVHWIDLSDDPGWIDPMLADEALAVDATAAGLVVLPGLSTIPALSGALARWCLARRPTPTDGRVTLFIGNRNRKGAAAIASALTAGLDDPMPIDLPVGRRLAYRFGRVDPVLRRPGERLPDTEFRVAFELQGMGRVVAEVSRLTRGLTAASRERLARLLAALAAPAGFIGSSTGCLHTELWNDAGRATASFIGTDQRMAIVPALSALHVLLAGSPPSFGVLHPAAWLSPDEWVAVVERHGIQLKT